MIQFTNIQKTYTINDSKKHVLDNVSFSIHQGQIFGIVGESGAGKSTLLKLLLQLVQPDAGHITFEEKDLSTPKVLQEFRHQSSMVYQEPNLLKNKTVHENVALPLKLRGLKNDAKIKEVLKFVGLENFENEYPATLSGGEKQRLSIARSLVTEPSILICDEPTASLDFKSTQNIQSLLKSIHSLYQTTIILVTHDLNLAKDLCSDVMFIDKGEVVKNYTITNTKKTESHQNYRDYVEDMLK